jgi:hypothetical protein
LHPQYNRNSNFSAATIIDVPAGVSSDVTKFWGNLILVVKNSNNEKNESISTVLNLNDSNKRELWNKCWYAASRNVLFPNDLNSIISLPKALLKLPNIVEVIPTIDNVITVLINALSELKKVVLNYKLKSKSFNTVVPMSSVVKITFEIIVNVVRDRLIESAKRKNLINNSQEVLKSIDTLQENYRKELISNLTAFPAEAISLGNLLGRMVDFSSLSEVVKRTVSNLANEQSILIHNGVNNAIDEIDESIVNSKTPWNGWKINPTVGWLMSESWHEAPELRNIYESSDDYADSLLRIWTLLTFYWGAGALWPRCSYKNNQGNNNSNNNNNVNADVMICGEPLLASACNLSIACCSRFKGGNNCRNKASWKCHRFNHDAICSDCLKQKQLSLIGSPSPNASTDIYDAVVAKEELRREGYIYHMQNLASRKPPRIPPNWNTSYRLKSSNLIAVVPLGFSKENLTSRHRIQWAEVITFETNSKTFSNEGQRRNKGQISIRLLTRGDCSSFASDVETPLSIGTQVALIDLRVFVPEVVSVLATFANDSFKIHLSKIPFIRRLIGVEPSPNIHNLLPFPTQLFVSIEKFVDTAIRKSEIECILMLSDELKTSIINEIVALKPIKSLYGTQLQAFGAALCCSIHCTQGPPGTGKVYFFIFIVYIFLCCMLPFIFYQL